MSVSINASNSTCERHRKIVKNEKSIERIHWSLLDVKTL